MIPRSIQPTLIGLILPFILIITWDLSVRFSLVPATLIASPMETLSAFWSMIQDGSLLANSYISCQRLVFGFVIGSLSGIVLGSLIGTNRLGAHLLEPTISVIAPVPTIAWVPLTIMLFGIGEASKIILIAFGTIFVVALHTSHGIRNTSREYVELAHILNKNQIELFSKVLFPSTLPQIFTGMRVAMALSWTLLLVSEIIASSNGLGWLIWDARNFSRPADMFVGMIVVGLLGRFTDMLLVTWEKTLTKWRYTYDTWQKHVERPNYSH